MARTLKSAATHALDVLRVIRDSDADGGVADPDVLEAIRHLEVAIGRVSKPRHLSSTDGYRRPNRWGYTHGELLQICDGRHKGKALPFAGVANSTRIFVLDDLGSPVTVSARQVERT